MYGCVFGAGRSRISSWKFNFVIYEMQMCYRDAKALSLMVKPQVRFCEVPQLDLQRCIDKQWSPFVQRLCTLNHGNAGIGSAARLVSAFPATISRCLPGPELTKRLTEIIVLPACTYCNEQTSTYLEYICLTRPFMVKDCVLLEDCLPVHSQSKLTSDLRVLSKILGVPW